MFQNAFKNKSEDRSTPSEIYIQKVVKSLEMMGSLVDWHK
jgi:hypothetical protein